MVIPVYFTSAYVIPRVFSSHRSFFENDMRHKKLEVRRTAMADTEWDNPLLL